MKKVNRLQLIANAARKVQQQNDELLSFSVDKIVKSEYVSVSGNEKRKPLNFN